MILEKIEALKVEVANMTAKNASEADELYVKHLSKKGDITLLMQDFRNVPADQKKEVGMKINELKQMCIARINELKEQTAIQENGDEAIDLTRTAYPIELGSRHPLTIVKNEIIDISAHGLHSC